MSEQKRRYEVVEGHDGWELDLHNGESVDFGVNWEDANKVRDLLNAQVEQIEQIEQLKAALTFYADDANWQSTEFTISAMDADDGTVAREALAKVQP